MSTHNIYFIINSKKFPKISIDIYFLGLSREFPRDTKNEVELARVYKRAIGIRVIEVLLYMKNVYFLLITLDKPFCL